MRGTPLIGRVDRAGRLLGAALSRDQLWTTSPQWCRLVRGPVVVGYLGGPRVWAPSFAGWLRNAFLCSLQIEVRAQQLVARQHKRPVFGVVVRGDEREHEVVQVCRRRAT